MEQKPLRRRAGNYILRLFLQRALGLVCYLLGAGFVLNLRAGVYFAGYFAVTAASCAVMLRVNAETLAARGKTRTDSPRWDKLLLGVYWFVAYFFIYFVAGLEAASAPRPGLGFLIGMALQIPACWISIRALMVNTYLESTARIQHDRGQTVCTAGPYRIVRHPTYAAILIWCVSVSLIFQTADVAVCALVCAVVIVVRTAKEDAMLRAQLPGYEAYAAATRYRLIPYLW